MTNRRNRPYNPILDEMPEAHCEPRCPNCGSHNVRRLGDCENGEWKPDLIWHCMDCPYPDKAFTTPQPSC